MRTVRLLVVLAASIWTAQLAAQAFSVPETIRITTLKGPTGIGMLTLLESKSLKLADGRTVRLDIEVAGTPDIADARIAARQTDFVTVPVNQAARLYNLGAGVRLGGVNIWGVLYLVSADSGLADWKAIKGKRIYSTGKGATPDIVFRELASRNGLDPDKDFTLDYSLGQVEIAQLMIAGKIETACLPEPFVTRVLLKKTNLAIALDLQKEWARQFGGTLIAQGGIAVRSEFADRYPELTRALLAAYGVSTQEAASAPGAAARVAALDLGIDADSFKASLGRLNLRWVDAAGAKTAVEQFLKTCLAADPASVGGRVPDARFYFQ